MCLQISKENHVCLLEEYIKLIDEKTGRARTITEVENNPFKMVQCDNVEAAGITQLYLSCLHIAAKALLEGHLQKFDAVIGDHSCHVTALVAHSAFQDAKYREEAEHLLEIVKSKKGQVQFNARVPTKPIDLIRNLDCDIRLSEKMRYLAIAALLKSGSECLENADGTMVLKVDPSIIQQRLAKKCPVELIKRQIVPLRQYLNARSVTTVKELSTSLLPVMTGQSPRGEIYQYPCAFLCMKASLTAMLRLGVHFVFVKYNPKGILDQPPIIFKPLPFGEMQLVEQASLDQNTPVFVIQGFFNTTIPYQEVANRLEEYGPIRFILASIAVNPQFVDMNESAFSRNEDLLDLPSHEDRTTIAHYRTEGKHLGIHTEHPTLLNIAHTYGDLLKNLRTPV